MADPLIGTVLGDYQILDLMGQGGMARVYRGYDPKLQRYAAVKVTDSAIVPEDLQDEYETRFIREARAIARLKHPNIVGVYQFDQQDGLNFMAMHFIEGEDLRRVLAGYYERGQVMPEEQILTIIRDIASALDYAHANGVIHRDIKPSNIMVTPQGQAILTDFGLALNAPDGTVGRTFGSAHYIAPEQAISSAKSVPQSDLYALGVVLYEMATGRVPFDDPSTMSIALMHLNDPPPLPSSVNPHINPRLEAVILQLLRKRPEERYPNGAALIQALWDAFAAPASEPAFTGPAMADAASWDDPDGWGTDAPATAPAEDAATLLLPEEPHSAAASPAARPARAAAPRRARGLVLGLVLLGLVAAGLFAAAQAGLLNDPRAILAGSGTPVPATATEPEAHATPLPSPAPTETPAPTPTRAAPPQAGADSADLLLIYDTQTALIVNASDRYLNIQSLEFRRPNPRGGPDVFFRMEDLRNSAEPPSAFAPGSCFHLIRMDSAQSPADIPVDDACTMRVGWRLLSQARWFWIEPTPDATFTVVSFGTLLAECEIAAGQCAITLP